MCVHKYLFLHLKSNKSYTLRVSCFCGLITFFGISHNFRKAKHYTSVGLRYMQVDTYFLCVPSSSWLWFNWFDNSSSFPKTRRAISPLGGPYNCILIWVWSYFQLSGVLKCTQLEIMFHLVWTMLKNFLSHYFKIVIFHIKPWISIFSLKIGISSNTGARDLSWQKSTGLAWRQLLPSNACESYCTLHTSDFHIYVTCLSPWRISLTMTFWSFPGYRKPFSFLKKLSILYWSKAN